METADLLAQTAPGAPLFIYRGYPAAPEFVCLSIHGIEQQVEVSGIHITIGKHLVFRQSGKGADYGCLSGTPFTA
jgi:hypothetical protein